MQQLSSFDNNAVFDMLRRSVGNDVVFGSDALDDVINGEVGNDDPY